MMLMARMVPVHGTRVWPSLTNPNRSGNLTTYHVIAAYSYYIVNELGNLFRHMVATSRQLHKLVRCTEWHVPRLIPMLLVSRATNGLTNYIVRS